MTIPPAGPADADPAPSGPPELMRSLDRGVSGIRAWEGRWGSMPSHPSLAVGADRLDAVIDELIERLHDNYPFFHPRYAGQMLKPPHPVAAAAYLTAMQINPNAHALDGGPATAALEREALVQLAELFGFPEHLGHLTSSGTIANLEALFVARELHPDRGVAFSANAHYTHGRMCGVLRMPGYPVAAGPDGRIDLDALRGELASGRVGTVVATAGTTGIGAVDPIAEIVELAGEFGARVHVDAAYGGFFAVLAQDAAGGADPADPPLIDSRPWRAIARADSVVVDPHKHGLQPYGCGAVLFRDPSVGRFYVHDSPYTYFTSDELHLGEISLECSRAGAAAAAFWATLRCFPLRRDVGLGPVLAATRRAARAWDAAVGRSERLRVHVAAELDIVSYFAARPRTTSAIDRSSAAILAEGMGGDDPVFVSTLTVPAAEFAAAHPDVVVDSDTVRVLRSVLMKPEHEFAVPWLVERISDLALGVDQV